jgi:predicted phage terminase large subunit-like protein
MLEKASSNSCSANAFTALKDGEENDYSACLTINVYEDAAGSYEFFVTDIYRGKHIYPELEKQLKLKYEIYTPGVIVIEDAGAGTTLIQNLQGKLHIKGYKPKISKIERFMGTTGYFSDGRIRFQKDIPALEQFKKEIFQFPSGKHDDMVDALMQAVDYIKAIIDVILLLSSIFSKDLIESLSKSSAKSLIVHIPKPIL